MIKYSKKLQEFYDKLIAKENISHREAIDIYESLHKEAVRLNVINSENILDGIDVDIRIAKALNSLP